MKNFAWFVFQYLQAIRIADPAILCVGGSEDAKKDPVRGGTRGSSDSGVLGVAIRLPFQVSTGEFPDNGSERNRKSKGDPIRSVSGGHAVRSGTEK
jgi:hypothetical protein